MDPTEQYLIDEALTDLDISANRNEFEANAILAVSIAACKAGAAEKEVPAYKYIADLSSNANPERIPIPSFTVINGGEHADNHLAIRDIMIVPTGASSFAESMQMGSETYQHLKAIISEKYGPRGCTVREDGSLAPNISSIREGLDVVKEAISRTGRDDKIKIAIDVGASAFCMGYKDKNKWKKKTKFLTCISKRSRKNLISGCDLIELYKELCAEYSIVIANPFDKDDWKHIKDLSNMKECQVVGDELLSSSLQLINRAIDESICNAFHLMINQFGTVTNIFKAVELVKNAQWTIILSQQIGETEDPFIADLVVGLGIDQMKGGAPYGIEQAIKYNQLLRIEEELRNQTS